MNNYIKANRKGSREAELEINRGFKSNHKIHRSKKTYNRKTSAFSKRVSNGQLEAGMDGVLNKETEEEIYRYSMCRI